MAGPRSHPKLQELFDDPILEQVELASPFADHGSSVYRVRTAGEHVVVRSFRPAGLDDPFWRSGRALFGIDPVARSELLALYALLSDVSPIAIPEVQRAGVAGGRTWLVVALVQGTPLERFDELSDDGLVELGRALATIHERRFDTFGNPSGSFRYPPAEFNGRVKQLFRSTADARLDEMCAAVDALVPPGEGSLVLLDLFAPQFLASGGRVVAMVDIDAYAVGPRELDLVCLEYFVDARAAELVARGYREIAPWPSLRRVRRAYRYLFWALDMNPMALDVDRFLSWPRVFA